jgi:hypothetical protein
MHVRLECQERLLICADVHALHIEASVDNFMRQDSCRNVGVTNGMFDVLVRVFLV